jgi:hypothetical protein
MKMTGSRGIIFSVLLAASACSAAGAATENPAAPVAVVTLAGGGIELKLADSDGAEQKFLLATGDIGDPESKNKTALTYKVAHTELNKDWRVAVVEIEMRLKQNERSVRALLIKNSRNPGDKWRLVREFVANTTSSGALASRKETHSLVPAAGTLTYSVQRKYVLDMKHLPSCACCLPMANPLKTEDKALTYSFETQEEEQFVWKDDASGLVSTESKKWYVIQPGDTFKTIREKLKDDGKLLGTIYALNPSIQEHGMPPEGQRIMIAHDKK